MFGNGNNKSTSTKSVTLVGRGAQFEGKVRFAGTLEIEGDIIGDISADESSKSEVIVREHGVVEGQIQSPRVVVNGKVVGDIYASDQLFIAAKAVIEGSVHYRLIEMEKGAQISGSMLHRPGGAKSDKSDKSTVQSISGADRVSQVNT